MYIRMLNTRLQEANGLIHLLDIHRFCRSGRRKRRQWARWGRVRSSSPTPAPSQGSCSCRRSWAPCRRSCWRWWWSEWGQDGHSQCFASKHTKVRCSFTHNDDDWGDSHPAQLPVQVRFVSQHQLDVTREPRVAVHVRDRNALEQTDHEEREARHAVVHQIQKIDATLETEERKSK